MTEKSAAELITAHRALLDLIRDTMIEIKALPKSAENVANYEILTMAQSEIVKWKNNHLLGQIGDDPRPNPTYELAERVVRRLAQEYLYG